MGVIVKEKIHGPENDEAIRIGPSEADMLVKYESSAMRLSWMGWRKGISMDGVMCFTDHAVRRGIRYPACTTLF